MNTISRQALKDLIGQAEAPCVSFYLPTYRADTVEVSQNRIRLKNLLTMAQRQLVARGMRSPEAQTLLAPAQALLDDPLIWADAAAGAALFCTTQRFWCWKLPQTFPEGVWVGEFPYIKPLLPLLDKEHEYFLLAVSENDAKLLRGLGRALAPIEVPRLPASLKSALHLHPPEGLFQVRTGQPALHSKEGAVFHGQGEAEHAKEELKEYFRAIDRAVAPFLMNRPTAAPLVFCGVDYLFPIYREVNTYPHLVEKSIPGNPRLASDDELSAAAAGILSPLWERVQQRDAQHIQEHLGEAQVSGDIEQILQATEEGRVEALFVAQDAQLWGRYDSSDRHAHLAQTSGQGEELLDRVAREALLHGARVYAARAAEIPGGLVVAARYRYTNASE